jgi:hypothetical protein
VTQRSYYTLIASLPNLPPTFEVERPPITRERLKDRLRLLHEKDAAVIDQVSAFLAWDRQPLDRTDEQVVSHYGQLMEDIGNPLVRELVNSRIDIRTIVSAIRRRRLNGTPPSGVGQWVDHIRRNWTQPGFALAGRYPWIGDVERLIADGDPMEAQRRLFAENWRVWSRMAERYTFSFEAVILYLARWEVIDRWTSRNAEAGRQRFEELITETLGEYGNLYKRTRD